VTLGRGAKCARHQPASDPGREAVQGRGRAASAEAHLIYQDLAAAFERLADRAESNERIARHDKGQVPDQCQASAPTYTKVIGCGNGLRARQTGSSGYGPDQRPTLSRSDDDGKSVRPGEQKKNAFMRPARATASASAPASVASSEAILRQTECAGACAPSCASSTFSLP
jgi:hypothetical protein